MPRAEAAPGISPQAALAVQGAGGNGKQAGVWHTLDEVQVRSISHRRSEALTLFLEGTGLWSTLGTEGQSLPPSGGATVPQERGFQAEEAPQHWAVARFQQQWPRSAFSSAAAQYRHESGQPLHGYQEPH